MNPFCIGFHPLFLTDSNETWHIGEMKIKRTLDIDLI